MWSCSPDRVELDIDQLDGPAASYDSFSCFPRYGNSTRKRVSWIVKGRAGAVVSLEAESTRAGVVRTTVILADTSRGARRFPAGGTLPDVIGRLVLAPEKKDDPVSTSRSLENRFLGSLLGLAIGDALGMPVADLSVAAARERIGEIRDYLPRNEGADDAMPAGEITDETETVLCIVESMTANNGQVDAENINMRMLYLVEGPSRHWMPAAMREGITEAFPLDGQLPERDIAGGTLAVAVRGVPIGLMHGVGAFDPELVIEDTRRVTRVSHPGRAQHQLVLDVALAVASIVREEEIAPIVIETDLDAVADERRIIAELADRARRDVPFEDVVFEAVNSMRPADSAGAIAGAFAGARAGAGGIPQGMIDGLEARVYLSLAAPWLHKTAARRAGTLIDLRQV